MLPAGVRDGADGVPAVPAAPRGAAAAAEAVARRRLLRAGPHGRYPAAVRPGAGDGRHVVHHRASSPDLEALSQIGNLAGNELRERMF